MKKIFFIILLFFNFILQAQNIQSYLSTATFNSDEGSFLELYMAFDVNTLELNRLEDLYFGEIEIRIDIEDKDSVIYTNHYFLKSPSFKKENNNDLFFFDQQRILLNNGFYNINIDVFDKKYPNNIQNHSKEIIVDYPCFGKRWDEETKTKSTLFNFTTDICDLPDKIEEREETEDNLRNS